MIRARHSILIALGLLLLIWVAERLWANGSPAESQDRYGTSQITEIRLCPKRNELWVFYREQAVGFSPLVEHTTDVEYVDPRAARVFKEVYCVKRGKIELCRTVQAKVTPAETIPEKIEWPPEKKKCGCKGE